MRTFISGDVDGYFLFVHAEQSPRDDEWSQSVELMKAYAEVVSKPRFLIVTAGGGPSPKQRSAMDRVLKPHYPRMKAAAVSGSTFIRGVITAFRLIHPFYRAFDPKDIDAALDYLDLPRSGHGGMKRQIEEWQSDLRIK